MKLAISPSAGVEVICTYDLMIECPSAIENPVSNSEEGRSRVISAHAPFGFDSGADESLKDLRIHIASTNKELRRASLEAIAAYIREAHSRFPNLQKINMHAAPKLFFDPPVSPHKHTLAENESFPKGATSWALLVEGTRELAQVCKPLGLMLTVENNLAYWLGVDPSTPPDQVDFERVPVYWCSAYEEWSALPREVNEPNLKACLDPSHAAPFLHRLMDLDARREGLMAFVSDFDLLGHFHWNDSDIVDPVGRKDMHLCIGEGTLGAEFHGKVKAWAKQTGHVPLLEHFYSVERLEKELEYINNLP